MTKAKARGHIQFAALPYRKAHNGKQVVMLLTSRETRRWVIPKGWPMKGRKPREVAAQEAFEEAGLRGKIIGKRPIGRYQYDKQLSPGRTVPCEVVVYLLRVERELKNWPERAERERRWFEPGQASELVLEDGLAAMLRQSFAEKTTSSVADEAGQGADSPDIRG